MTATPPSRSATPLAKKLGAKPGMTVQLLHADAGWRIPPDGLPDDLTWLPDGDDSPADLIVAFFRATADLLAELDALGPRIHPAGMLWLAWPRKAAGRLSDLSDSVVRAAGLDRGLVDVKVAALDQDWSSLKFVWRLTSR
ncbi:DUF3052 domain-containing protein [Leifsonia poae]|uniref:DUF3052 domain-containing protein n=1 Tax=Leifsonia poae TaxID=110933 RepID=UPI001CBC6789|nr:DUF3052 domain-containing protein [Leifsonia poae]